MRAILDEDAPLPEAMGERHATGFDIYRGNYRSALVGALENTFERTARHIGEETFKKVCAHHLIANPPAGWTIEEAGARFDATCAQLFVANPEVAELAWLEWAMLKASKASDFEPLSPDGFAVATSHYAEEDWMRLHLTFQPGATSAMVNTRLVEIWNSLAEEAETRDTDQRLTEQRGCIVSREGDRPVFEMVPADSACAFSAMSGGARYGEIVLLLAGEEAGGPQLQQAAMRAGALLGEWLREGLITGFHA